MATNILRKTKLNQTAAIKLKEKQIFEVHDNLLNIIHHYLNCDPKYEKQYKSRLINQSNITQYFFQALFCQVNPQESQILVRSYQTILADLSKIPDTNKFVNQVATKYKSCLIQKKLDLIEFSEDLKQKATNQEIGKFLNDMVSGISRSRNEDQEYLEKCQINMKEGKNIESVRKNNEFNKRSEQDNIGEDYNKKNMNILQIFCRECTHEHNKKCFKYKNNQIYINSDHIKCINKKYKRHHHKITIEGTQYFLIQQKKC